MAVNLQHLSDLAEDDYIDMEVSSYSSFLSHSVSSSSCPREFEFQMSLGSLEREPTTSPADELFYKGKLLPLHLPPRLQMVEKLLENSSIPSNDNNRKDHCFDEFFSTPLATTAPTPTSASTPFESCNISPSESCQVSRELSPDEYIFEYAHDIGCFVGEETTKKSWTKKLKLIKQSFIGSKLKASRTYIKSFFGKPGCSNESCVQDARNLNEGVVFKARESLHKHVKAAKKGPLGEIHRDKYQEKSENNLNVGGHRRSFSVSLKWHPSKKSTASASISSGSSSTSSSSSDSSNGFKEYQFLKRCSSANYEVENSIQGAIAHCKQSQQLHHSSEVGFCSLSASRISVDKEKPELLRG